MESNVSAENYNLLSTSFSKLHVLWCTKDYEEDFFKILLEREAQRMAFQFQSPQINFRSDLVDWMKTIAVKKTLDHFTIHLAVYLLDIFMDNYNIAIHKLKLIALTCMILATKFEERDCNIIKMNEINETLENKYDLSDYNALEGMVLKLFEWNLLHPTCTHFVHIYLQHLFTDEEIKRAITYTTESDFWYEVRHFIKKYLDYVMDDINLMQEKPSIVAAAIMTKTRENFGFQKIWPDKLLHVTGYNLFELKNTLLRFKQIDKNNSSKIYNNII